MTGDELAAALYAEQGFMVIESSCEEKIGDIVKCSNLYEVNTPLIIAGLATREEFMRQAALAFALAGNPEKVGDIPEPGNHHYYRVEAAD